MKLEKRQMQKVGEAGDNEMMTVVATCIFFGGDRPLNPATLYRGIKAGRYPRPIHLGSRISRWLRSECEVAREKLIAARDEPEAA
jgi:hypothetical protein